MSTSSAPLAPEASPPNTGALRIGATVALLAALLVIFLAAFALPSLRSAPSDIPVAITAPAGGAAELQRQLDAAQPGALTLRPAADAAEAERMILDREVYGALRLDGDGLTVTTASAASVVVAELLDGLGEQLAEGAGLPLHSADAVPLPADDPRGVGLVAGALPIALGGWIAAVGIIATVRGSRQRIVAAIGFALIGGFALTAVLQFWFGTLAGSYPATALGACLGLAATSLLVLGLQRLLSGVGIAIAATVLILLGNPLSGLSSAPEVLPQPWGALGQLLPPGATGTLLRNTAFFDGAAIAAPVTALGAWVVLGLGSYLLAGWLAARRAASGGDASPAPVG